VSSVVNNRVRKAERDAKVSGHRLRIGGVVPAVKGGWSRADSWAVGGWKSEVLRWLRDLGVTERGGSNSMGFRLSGCPVHSRLGVCVSSEL
jgi:hypothetical protein